ncbi:MAG: NAD(P)-dependent oxidoreductase [Pseudomonadales bacterium]
MTLTIGWIGLGTMGGPMAGHLVRAQHKVQAFNRNAERAERWQQQYKLPCVDSVTAAALGADMVFTCVSNDDALREVAHATFPHMKPGAVLVDHSTTSARVARELYVLAAQQGLHFIDAPISGGQAGAEKGQLAVMAGGDAAAFTRIEPVIAAYSKRAKRIGDAGAGQLTKMVNEICFTGVVAGLAEGLFFAESAGLDTDAVLEVISQGAAQSWQMDNRAHTMLRGEYDFGFAVDWVRKDLEIALAAAKDFHCELPGVTQINLWYETLQKMGHGNSDTSALLERLRHQKT